MNDRPTIPRAVRPPGVQPRRKAPKSLRTEPPSQARREMPDRAITSFGRDNKWSLPPGEAARQAIAALQGYAYQLHQTAAAWIKLQENEHLYVEVAEDFAHVTGAPDQVDEILRATQVKSTRESGSVTLNSPDVQAAIRQLFALQEANPEREVRLTFLTTSPYGKEKKQPLSNREAGIFAWQVAAAGGDVAALRSALAKRFHDGKLVKFIRESSGEELRRRLLKPLTFVCGAADWEQVELDNRQALVAMRDEVQATANRAERAYEAILAYILRAILRPGERMLDRRQFLSCFADATSIALPSEIVEGITRIAVDAALRRPQHATISGSPPRLAEISYKYSGGRASEYVTSLLNSRPPPHIVYCESIVEAFEKLEGRNQKPEEFFRQNPNLRDLCHHEQRETQAAALHAYNGEVLRKAKQILDHNNQALRGLIAHLKRLRAPADHAAKSLETFTSLAALLMIQALKRGFDWGVEGSPEPWFEAFKFNSDPSYCLLDWTPRQSSTGRVVFNYRYWVGARVGHERHYEYVMFPLKFVLPLFRDAIRGHLEAFYTWVLPQLLLIRSHHPIEEFPTKDWEAFLLQGAGGKEWWSRHRECPWPEVVNVINMAEL